MSVGFNRITDLYDIYDTIQNTLIRYPKDQIIASLRDYFSKDSKYHYVKDEYGFPKVVDVTDMPTDAGITDDLTTRVFIGEKDVFDVIFYPAILISAGNFKSVPISLNRRVVDTEIEVTEFVNEETGQVKRITQPCKFVPCGVWEGTINIEVKSKGIIERDDLVELVSLFMVDYNWSSFYRAGIAIKPTGVNIGSYSSEQLGNEKIFKVQISVEIRGEWQRDIPFRNIIDAINICVEIGNISIEPPETAPNLEINTKVNILDIFNEN